MRTIKQVSDITGVSVRMLHYYDKIGLLKPSSITEAGYRLYGDESFETLQQILFFKELNIPLKNMKEILVSSQYDKVQTLRKQKELLTLKRDRLNEIIALIERKLKGGSTMSFKEFDTSQMDALFTAMLDKLDEERRISYILEHGGDLETARKTFGENLNKNKADLERYTGEQNLHLMVCFRNNKY